MTGKTNTAVLAGLAFLTVTEAALGGWILLAPRSFFALAWVHMHLPYNEHLLLDVGAMNLALAVLLATAAVRREPGLVRAALVTYLVFSVAHALIHIRYLDHLPPAQSAVLLTLLTIAAVIPAVLLFIAGRGTSRR